MNVIDSEQNNLEKISEEIKLMSLVNHPNILKIISGWYNQQKGIVVMITEFISGGSLKQNLKRIKQPRLCLIKKWITEILSGLDYLHNKNIIHRDIKCDNILLDKLSGVVKIGDLGASELVNKKIFSTQYIGTEAFMSPEVQKGKYTFKADIYSLGLTIIEMLTLEIPYKECEGTLQLYEKKSKGIYPNAMKRIKNENVLNFIKLCLKKEEERPTAKELLNNPWLNDLTSPENDLPVSIQNFSSSFRQENIYKPKSENIKKINEQLNIHILKNEPISPIIFNRDMNQNKKYCNNVQEKKSFNSNKELPFTELIKKKQNEIYASNKNNINNSIKDIISSNLSPNKKKSDSNLKSGFDGRKKKSTFQITIKNPSSNSINIDNKNSSADEIEIQFIIGKEEWKNKSKIIII